MTHPGAAEPIRQLEELGCELAARGWITNLRAEPGRQPPSLYVQNPDPGAAALNDYVLVAPDADGASWYWWPWAVPIAPADQAAAAADRVTHVLRATDPHPAISTN